MLARTVLPIAAIALAPVTAAPQTPPQAARSSDTPRSVTLTLAEYNRLIDQAARSSPTAPAPVGAVLGNADLSIRVDGGMARGSFALGGQTLRPGVSRVNLTTGATMLAANAGGQPVPLVAEGIVHAALLTGLGPFALTLDWAAPLTMAPGRAAFLLPVPHAGSVRATFDLPGEVADVRLSNGLITRRTAANGRTMVDATLPGATTTQVSWSMRDSAPVAAARDLRTVADVMTLVTIGETDIRMVALVDVTALQGELRTVTLQLPSGFEVISVSSASLTTSDERPGELVLTANEAAESHQALVSLARPYDGQDVTLDTDVVSVRDVQRERGDVAIEGIGTLELNAAERDGLQRIDAREVSPALQSLGRLPVLAAFRYQRTAAGPRRLALAVTRFPGADVLAAVADSATATTLVTSEGRALTQVELHIQNRAQPFLKVTLPSGATMVSVDVAGETAKPVVGADGIRVPLLRAGFRPTGPYRVSFVYLHAGSPFANRGDAEVTLPRMDMPVGLVSWEVFFPERYQVRMIDGNVLDARLPHLRGEVVGAHQVTASGVISGGGTGRGVAGGIASNVRVALSTDGLPGQVRGRVTDTGGGALPGVAVELTASGRTFAAVTDSDGGFLVSGVPSGTVRITAQLPGFASATGSFAFDERPRDVTIMLSIGALVETVTVNAEAPRGTPTLAPSTNVVNLQRRTAGVLPIRVDIPRAGVSHEFVRPLVVNEETVLKVRYRRR